MTIKNINFSTNNINNIQRACVELGSRIGKELTPKVSFDVAEINGKVFMSVQNLLTEKNNKGVFLKLVKGNDNASILLAKGKDKKLKEFMPESSKIVNQKINEMTKALERASRDEAKSLIDF